MLLALLAMIPAAGVVYATRDRAYLDLGLEEGLASGSEVELVRGTRSILRCRIDQISLHHASCAVAGARAGDQARFTAQQLRTVAPVISSTIGPARPEPSEEELSSAKHRLASEPFAMVESTASGDIGVARRFDAALGLTHETFLITGDRDFERERVDLVLRDLSLGFWGATAGVDLTAFLWTHRPEDARFRPRHAAQLYVYETAIYARERDASFTAAIGRIIPWHAPGIVYLDGLQIGWRPAGTRLEVGLVGGTIPDLLTLEPTIDRWLADAYWSIEAGEKLYFASEGRIGAGFSESLSVIGELESRVYLRLDRWLSASLGGRGVIDRDGPALAGAQLSLSLDPLDDLRITVDGELRDERFELALPTASIFAAEHASMTATYLGLSFITVGASGGVGHLRADDQLRGFAGPELGFPHLFGEAGDLFAGYQEAFGFVPGRTVFVQAILHPAQDLELFSRISYLEDRVVGGTLEELGAFIHLDWRAFRYFRLRASLLGTAPFADIGELGPLGFYGRLSLVGEL